MTAYLSGIAWSPGAPIEIGSAAAEGEIEGPAQELFDMGFRTFLRSDKSVTELGLEALQHSLAAEGLGPDAVDALVFCTNTYAAVVPRLQKDLEARLRAAGFRHVNLFMLSFGRCSNLPSALIFARNLLDTGEAKRVALVTADLHDPANGPRNSQNNTQVMSDAGASCLVSQTPGGYRVEAIKRVSDLAISTERLVGSAAERVEAYRNYHNLIGELAAQIDADAVDTLITHNMAVPSIRAMAAELGVAGDKLYEANVPKIGHAFCADGLVNLEASRAGRDDPERPGRAVLLLTGINTHAVVQLGIGAG